jgi:hypothetical protein
MAISKPRNRVVLFRLTQEEYAQVQQACTEGGARSVSDFARARILGQSGGDSPALVQMQAQIEELTRAVELLARVIAPRVETAAAAAAGYGTAYAAKSGD